MKDIKYVVVLLILLVILPINVLASGSISPNTKSVTVNKGGSATFKITANNAVGRVDISSSDNSIATVNKSSEWLENDSVTVTVTGVSVGNVTIVVALTDAATFDEEELTGTYAVSVVVKDSKSGTSQNNNNNNNNNLSKNNKLSSLVVENYELNKIDDNNYDLTVDNNVDSIKINATAEDQKAKVSGIGVKNLEVGLNTFEVIVTSESGAKNVITIKVTRKDGYYLEDLKKLLEDANTKNISVIIKNDEKITKENLDLIKSSKKKVEFNYYDEDKKLIYSWELDGSKISDTKDINSNIVFSTENINKISELSNYADGLYLNFSHNGTLPSGIKVKIYVGDRFEDKIILNLYYYNKEKSSLDIISKNLEVKDGYIEFELEHCSEYFVTRSNIGETQSSNNSFKTIVIIESILIIGIIVLDIFKLNPISKINFKK